HLLRVDETAVETWLMTYDMVLEREQGPLHFHGYKVLHQQTGSNVWADLTTLFITVRHGENDQGVLLAQGSLTLDLEDLAWQASSMRMDVQNDWAKSIVERFPRAQHAIADVYLAK